MSTISTAVLRPLPGAFRRLWLATAASNLSDGLRLAVLPLLAASLTDRPALVAGVAVAAQAPWLVLGLVSGALVDRLDRRRLLGFAHLARLVVVAALCASAATGVGGLVVVYAAAVLLGAAETVFDNAAQTLVGQIVPAEDLDRANGRQAMAVIGGQDLVGPLLGATLFALAAPLALALDAAVLALAAGLVFALPPGAGRSRGRPEPAAHPVRGLGTEVAEGLRWLRAEPTLRAVTGAAALVNIAVVAHAAVLVLFALRELGLTEVGYALLLACAAIGGFVGASATPRLAAALRPPVLLPVVVAVAAGAVALVGLADGPLVAGAGLAVLGVAATTWSVVTSSLRQRMTPPWLLGRVIGAHQLCSWGGAAVGAALGGVVAGAFGLRAPFLAGAVLLAVVAVGLGLALAAAARAGRLACIDGSAADPSDDDGVPALPEPPSVVLLPDTVLTAGPGDAT